MCRPRAISDPWLAASASISKSKSDSSRCTVYTLLSLVGSGVLCLINGDFPPWLIYRLKGWVWSLKNSHLLGNVVHTIIVWRTKDQNRATAYEIAVAYSHLDPPTDKNGCGMFEKAL